MRRAAAAATALLLLAALALAAQRGAAAAAGAAAADAEAAPPHSVLFEPFDSLSRWVVSKAETYNGVVELGEPRELNGRPGDRMLVLPLAHRKYGLATPVRVEPARGGKPLVVQYEVRLTQELECGGAYLKLISAPSDGGVLDVERLRDDTPYTIMFGPDKCGAKEVVHFIFRHRNPRTGEFEEKHLKSPPALLKDTISHLYTLVVRPDNSFELLIDQQSVRAGSLLEDFEPAVNPPETIDDPTDEKPADWQDSETMPDPDARKPDDWDEDAPAEIPDASAVKPADWLDDEPEFVADPSVSMPSDWDTEEDGDWEAPLIRNPRCEETGCGEWKPPTVPNPAFRGKWSAPMVPNPRYVGPWKARQIPNPAYFKDEQPAATLTPIGAVSFELWTINGGIMFDNLLISESEEAAAAFAARTFAPRHAKELELKAADERVGAWNIFTQFLSLDSVVTFVSESWSESPVFVLSIATGLLFVVSTLMYLSMRYCCCCCRSGQKAHAADAAHKKDDDAPRAAASDAASDAAPAASAAPAPADAASADATPAPAPSSTGAKIRRGKARMEQ